MPALYCAVGRRDWLRLRPEKWGLSLAGLIKVVVAFSVPPRTYITINGGHIPVLRGRLRGQGSVHTNAVHSFPYYAHAHPEVKNTWASTLIRRQFHHTSVAVPDPNQFREQEDGEKARKFGSGFL